MKYQELNHEARSRMKHWRRLEITAQQKQNKKPANSEIKAS